MNSSDDAVDVMNASGTAMMSFLLRKWRVIAVAALVGCLLGYLYCVIAEPQFESEVTMVAADPSRGAGVGAALSQLGGLASLAGLGSPSSDKAEPIETLKSRSVVREFLSARGLVGTIEAKSAWARILQLGAPVPDQGEVLDRDELYFRKNVLRISEDKKTGLISLKILWRSPQESAQWANGLVSDVNARLRNRAIKESELSIGYLEDQMQRVQETGVKQSLGRVLETQLEKMILAKGTPEYAFRVVDAATTPTQKAWPKKRVVLPLICSISLLTTVLLLLVRSQLAWNANLRHVAKN